MNPGYHQTDFAPKRGASLAARPTCCAVGAGRPHATGDGQAEGGAGRSSGPAPHFTTKSPHPAQSPERRSGPPLLDNGHQPDQAYRRQDQIRATQRIYKRGMTRLIEHGAVSAMEIFTLEGWFKRMNGCGRTVWMKGCAAGHKRPLTECCDVPMCPRYQRKRSNHWIARVRALMASQTYKGKRPKLLTVALRHPAGETLPEAVEKVIKLRAVLMRHLRKTYGMTAAVAPLEMSDTGHVHLHSIVFSDFLPRALLQRWLRARDCTVSGCNHPADDRCDACREGSVECVHLDGERRRCNGSFMVDVRICYDPVEALKYAAAPVVCDGGDAEPTETQLEAAARTVRFYLAISGRHRVETYGDAKRMVEGEGDQDEDRDANTCWCGLPLWLCRIGHAPPGRNYHWRLPTPGETGPPGWPRGSPENRVPPAPS